jgi:hypothetical protein
LKYSKLNFKALNFITITPPSACVAFNYNKIHQNCTLLGDLGTAQEHPSFATGPKVCGNLKSKFQHSEILRKLNSTTTKRLPSMFSLIKNES